MASSQGTFPSSSTITTTRLSATPSASVFATSDPNNSTEYPMSTQTSSIYAVAVTDSTQHEPSQTPYSLSTILSVREPHLPSTTSSTPLGTQVCCCSQGALSWPFFSGISSSQAKYVRTIAARDKSLFHLLLFAQIWGPIAVFAMLLPLAYEHANCTATNLVAGLSIQISFAVLTSGILGIKAYRCLNRSRAVLAAIAITQISALALSAAEIPKLHSERSLAGACLLTEQLNLIPTAFILSTIETLVFVGMCFGYAIWHASRSASLGRLSLDLSNEPAAARGWWDYAPTAAEARLARSNSVSTTGRGETMVARSTLGADALTLGSLGHAGSRNAASHTAGWEKIGEEERAQAGSRGGQRRGSRPEDDDGPKFTRIVLLNDAVKNELFYTGCILACHTVAMIMFPVSSKYETVWPPVFWLGLSWAITSVLVIRTFEPVVKRHEREAILREPLQAGWAGAPDPMDVSSGPPRPKQTPWGRAISVSTNSVLSFPTVRRRGSAATSAAHSVAFSNAAHSNAFKQQEWASGTSLSAKRSNLNIAAVPGSSSTSAGKGTHESSTPKKSRTGTTTTALLPLNSSTKWTGSSVNPFEDAQQTSGAMVLPGSPDGTGPAPELWRRGSVSGLSISSAYGTNPGSSKPRQHRRPSVERRGSLEPPSSSRRGSAAGLGIANVPLVPIGEASTPLTPTFDLFELEPRRPSRDGSIHLVEHHRSALVMPAQSLLDLESMSRLQQQQPSPHSAAHAPHVRDGTRKIAFDLDVGVLQRSNNQESSPERRQFGSAEALLRPGYSKDHS
ncbi:hypothetical protein BKA62DRAFT_707945 [Auriculariales sp. MPI-PUGE-AT-0066]|nr:hypothetical protein BKA62DRAFT_707945 [Auriculariales sp. MPI-PUGE-AT-0066]